MRLRHTVTVLWSSALLCGCAASTQSGTTASHELDPDCSFRSPATCWTVSARFPVTRRRPAAQPEREPPQAPAVLANEADTGRSAREAD
jgi:hypothetical protein